MTIIAVQPVVFFDPAGRDAGQTQPILKTSRITPSGSISIDANQTQLFGITLTMQPQRIADPSRNCASDEITTPRRDHGADRLRPQKENVRATEACRLCGRTQLDIAARQAAGATARQTRTTRRRTTSGLEAVVHASLRNHHLPRRYPRRSATDR